MPVVEVATFQASDALLANPDLALGALAILKNAEGFLGAWTGYDVEDKKTAYLIVTWESVELHKKLHASPSYPELTEKLRPALGGPLNIIHVQFDKDHTVAFNAPVTELLTNKLKEGKTKEDLDSVVAELAKHYESTEGIHQPPVHGPVLEEPGTFVSAIGWDSLEANQAVASAEAATQGAKLLAVVDVKPVKVKFEKRA
ncbi:hypothetical protein NMY22_g3503 [Coprinellus aureogranulatus]|nr:hypothetical protein NMY22_g3503 [Coprinellus aureogranulatus]